MVAFTGPDRVTVNVSSSSSTVSPRTLTATVLLVSPGLNVRGPLAPVKSLPGEVAAGGGGAGGCGGADADGWRAGRRQRHGERGRDRAAVTLGHRHVAD